MDLNKLSNEELAQLASGKSPAPKAQFNLEDLTDDELRQLAGESKLEDPSLLSKIGTATLKGVEWAGKKVDSVTGAPTRAAIGAYQDGGSPLGAFAQQFGADPKKAPTGHQIAVKAGASDVDAPLGKFKGSTAFNVGSLAMGPLAGAIQGFRSLVPEQVMQKEFQPSTADVVGLGIDVGADPTNLLPAVSAVKGIGKGALKLGAGAAKLGEAAARTTRVGNIVADTAHATSEALRNVFKPTQAADFGKFVEIAQKHGIDPAILPESVEFGQTSTISRGARTVREGPIGELELKKFESGLDQVSGAIDNQVSKVSGGRPLDAIESGEAIRNGYNKAVDDLFNRVDVTYSQAIDMLPGGRLTPESIASVESKLNGLEKWAKGRVLRGIRKTDKEQGQQILNAVASVRAGNGSLKQTYEAMSDIGRIAFKQSPGAASDVPADVEKFRDLYFKLREEFINSTAKLGGPDMANSLIETNQQISMFNQDKAPIAKLMGNKEIAPEKLFKSLIVNGDSRKIGALKEVLSAEEFNQLRGSYLESIIPRDSNGRINFGALRGALERNKSIVSSLFTPEEVTDIGELVNLGERFGPSVLSTSGTGASGLYRNMLEGIKSGATNRATLENMKEAARVRSSKLPPAIVSPSDPKFSMPRRSQPEEAAKYMQILSTIGVSNEKENQSAAQRRLQDIVKKRISK